MLSARSNPDNPTWVVIRESQCLVVTWALIRGEALLASSGPAPGGSSPAIARTRCPRGRCCEGETMMSGGDDRDLEIAHRSQFISRGVLLKVRWRCLFEFAGEVKVL
jgi:hypothetical protein